MRLLRWGAFGLLAVVGAVGLAVAAVLWWSLPGGRIEAAVPGLAGPVQVGFDADGVPHIVAGSDEDAAAALGFVHARDRMFQMELMRRNASGRLSEVAGPGALPQDRLMRVLGLRARAEAELGALDGPTRGMLEAYARGVNAWIARRGRFSSLEGIVLGAPEAWTPVDSLLWGKTMALYLSGNWRGELARAALVGRLGAERVRELWPRQDGTPGPAAWLQGPAVGEAAGRLGAVLPAFPAAFTQPGTASNEWAVDGAHSRTGAPLLAGDPHLAYSMPGIWYLARVETNAGVLAGATAPGVPFMILGHNGRVAWTFTTTGADTQDVFVETALADGTYATPDGPRAFVVREERIGVRGGADEVLRVRETRHGPVVSDLDATPGGPVLAVAMAALAPGDTAAAGLLALNRVGSVAEAGGVAARISAPVQNLLVADRAGIGQFTTGRVPMRRAGDGVLPVDGADGRHDWLGFASGDALPHQVGPASGRLVNANERVAGPDFPVFMGADWFGDWRARRIRTLLDGQAQHDVAGFAAMLVDDVSAFAQAVLPRLLAVAPLDAASGVALTALQGWDGAMRTGLAQPLLFNEWMRAFVRALERRQEVPAGMLGTVSDAAARALGDGTWCGGSCEAMLASSLSAAAADFGGPARWGDLHRAEFAHPLLSRLPVLGRLAVAAVAQPGDDTTLFRGGSRSPDWVSVHGPSFRAVYDLADLDRSVFALAPGQSGHLLRRPAGLLESWRTGTTLRLGPERPGVEVIGLRP